MKRMFDDFEDYDTFDVWLDAYEEDMWFASER